MELTRNSNGTVYHRWTCRHADRERPWTWARGRSLMEVEEVTARLGVRPCRICRPLDLR